MRISDWSSDVCSSDLLVLRRSRTLAGLTDAEERVLWHHGASGPMSGFIWAPELHLVDGSWVMYFAAGPSGCGEDRSEERRVGKRCVSQCGSRCSRDQSKQKKQLRHIIKSNNTG